MKLSNISRQKYDLLLVVKFPEPICFLNAHMLIFHGATCCSMWSCIHLVPQSAWGLGWATEMDKRGQKYQRDRALAETERFLQPVEGIIHSIDWGGNVIRKKLVEVWRTREGSQYRGMEKAGSLGWKNVKRRKASEKKKRKGWTDGAGWDYFGAQWDYQHVVTVCYSWHCIYTPLTDWMAVWRVFHSCRSLFLTPSGLNWSGRASMCVVPQLLC